MPKFDVVVGNPPFQKEVKRKVDSFSLTNSGQKIWHKFVEIGFKILKDNGIIAFVTPDLWRTMERKTIKEAQDFIWNNNIIFTSSANNFFDVGGNVNIDYWIVSKNKDLKGMQIYSIFKKLKFLSHSKNVKIKEFYEDIEQGNNFEISIKSKGHPKIKENEIRQSEHGDKRHPYPHVNTIPQHIKKLYDWYNKKGIGFDQNKVITSVSVSKYLNSFYDPGKKGTGHCGMAYPVKDNYNGEKLVNFLNNSKIIKEIEKETQNQKGFTIFPIQLFKKIPKSWVERFNNGEDL